jgi:hypothetical protein
MEDGCCPLEGRGFGIADPDEGVNGVPELAGRTQRRHTRDRVLAADDYKEGVRAFLEKRPRVWPSLKKALI